MVSFSTYKELCLKKNTALTKLWLSCMYTVYPSLLCYNDLVDFCSNIVVLTLTTLSGPNGNAGCTVD